MKPKLNCWNYNGSANGKRWENISSKYPPAFFAAYYFCTSCRDQIALAVLALMGLIFLTPLTTTQIESAMQVKLSL